SARCAACRRSLSSTRLTTSTAVCSSTGSKIRPPFPRGSSSSASNATSSQPEPPGSWPASGRDRMPTWWARPAWLGGGYTPADVLREVKDDRFAAVTAGVTGPPVDATRLEGLALPGLANVHSHAFHRALRSRTQVGAGTFWAWRDLMYAVADRLNPDSYLR